MSICRENNVAFSVEIEAWTESTGSRRTDITNATSGLEIRYWSDPDGSVTTLAPAAQTSTGAHTNGGIVHKFRGTYRVDVPAINAPGEVISVTMGGLAGVEFSVARVQLIVGAPGAATVNANVTDMADGVLTAPKIATDAFTAAKFAADVTTELQAGLATSTALATVASYIDTEISSLLTNVTAILAAVDTEVAAIKAKTDALPASPAAVGSQMTLAAGAITALVNAIVRAANGADGYAIEKDPANNQIVLTIPGVGTVNIPATFNESSVGVDAVG